MIRSIECPECHGDPTRIIEGQLVDCWRCEGLGRIDVDLAVTSRVGLTFGEIMVLIVAVIVIVVIAVDRSSTAHTALGAVSMPAAEASPSPALFLEAEPSSAGEVSAAIGGLAAYADPSHGSRYLALPEGPGVRVRICHDGECILRTSTDAGPDLAMQRAGRVADLSYVDFRSLCDCTPEIVGTMHVSIEYSPGRGSTVTLPPTDVEP